MCRPHRAESQTSAALPACCTLNKTGSGQVVFVLRTFMGWQAYVEPQLDCGVHRVICTSQCPMISASISYAHTVPDNFYLFVRRWIPFAPVIPESWKNSISHLYACTLTQRRCSTTHTCMLYLLIRRRWCMYAPNIFMQVPGIKQKVLHACMAHEHILIYTCKYLV